MDTSPWLLRDGDQVRAAGRVVAVGDTAWFEPPLLEPLVDWLPGREPTPHPTGLGVPVVGVDLTDLADRLEKNGSVGGWAWLAGAWEDERLIVTEQGPPRWTPSRDPEWSRPPCPPPPDGWPADEGPLEPLSDPLNRYVTSYTYFRPAPDRAVAVIASERPAELAAVLVPRYGSRVCVVPSRWTRDQLVSTSDRLRESMRPWLIYALGESSGEDGQAVISIELTRVVPGFAAWAHDVPDGLLRVEPWLAPHRPA